MSFESRGYLVPPTGHSHRGGQFRSIIHRNAFHSRANAFRVPSRHARAKAVRAVGHFFPAGADNALTGAFSYGTVFSARRFYMKRTLPVFGPLASLALLAAFFSPAFARSEDLQGSASPMVVATHPAFELADIHLSTRKKVTGMSGGFLDGDHYIVHHATVAELIAKAYGFPARKVVGGPISIMNYRYDVIAKAPPDTSDDVVTAMLRNLLAERFKLVVHVESISLPAHLVTAPEGAIKMKQSEGSKTPGCRSDLSSDAPPPAGTPVTFSCRAESMTEFVGFLHEIMSNPTQPEVDATDLKGLWDFDFSALYPPRTSTESASNIEAIEKQLGLKIEAGRSMQAVLTVDSVSDSPMPNPPNVATLLLPASAKFAVASIKRSSPDSKELLGHVGNGQVILTGATLHFLINFAFDLNNETIVNAPKWLDQDKFDIAAAVTPPDATSGVVSNPLFNDEDLPEMTKKLLEERFGIKWHIEDRPADAYVLLAINPRMKKADPLFHSGCKEGPGPDGKDPRIATPVLGRLISCQNMTMAQLADELPLRSTGYIKIPMFDATGITGAYDFVLSFSGYSQVGGINEWSLNRPPSGSPNAVHLVVPPGGLLLSDAIEQQLGLRLEKQKRPTPMLVIDHINEVPKPH
ncbi:MAG TPA: TIGR03435 family protein [Acidobacteriaceae bacterium]|nr:TIGR03435 family protein [Acidobacteriaceae bacterium]